MEQQAENAVVVYHSHCMDGFASAWAFNTIKARDYKNEVIYLPTSYGDIVNVHFLERLIGKDVYILDFSFSRDDLINIASHANRVTLLDHHKTAQEILTNWPDQPENIEIVFDMDRSGAGITWDYFAPKCGYAGTENYWNPTLRPPLIDYIEDRDLWRFKRAKSKEINAYIALQEMEFAKYSHVNYELKQAPEQIALIGSFLLAQHKRICEQIAEQASGINIYGPTTAPPEYTGLCVNCTPQFASDVGNILAEKSGTFGLTYSIDKEDNVKYSIRSIGLYDVSEIAKKFGGGGHRNASGFTAPLHLGLGDLYYAR